MYILILHKTNIFAIDETTLGLTQTKRLGEEWFSIYTIVLQWFAFSASSPHSFIDWVRFLQLRSQRHLHCQ